MNTVTVDARWIFRSWWLLACLLLVAGCTPPPLAPDRPTMTRIDTDFRIDTLWYRQPQQSAQPAHTALTPLVIEDYIYHADRPARLVALDAHSGRVIWRRDLSPPDVVPEKAVQLSGGFGFGAGLLLVGTRQGSVIALDPDTGDRLWESQLSSELAAAPSARDSIVTARSNDGTLYALDAATGAQLWVYSSSQPPLSLRGAARPLIDGDQVYAGFSSGDLTALSLSDGEVLWEIAVGIPEGRSEFERLVDVDADPVLSGNTVYAASYQNRLVAVSTVSGRIVWSREMSVFQNLLLDGDVIYVTTEQDAVMAVDRVGGSILWRQDELAGRGLTAVSRPGDRLVVADSFGFLHWFSPDDGALIGRHRISEAPIRAPMVVRDDVLYVVDSENALQAIRVR